MVPNAKWADSAGFTKKHVVITRLTTSLQRCIHSLHATAARCKVDRVLAEAGVTEQQIEEAVNRVTEHHASMTDVANRLKAFRESVGEEMWATIANNPSLPQLLDKFAEEYVERMIDELTDIFMALLPPNSGLDRDTVRTAVMP